MTAAARPDPRSDAFPGQAMVYGSVQRLYGAWARRRYREDFERVRCFSLFVGYPRSGHSVVGAMLNAHRNAVVSHELNAPRLVLAGCGRDELFGRILARAWWFNLRGNRSNYRYQVTGGRQGGFEVLEVLGDKGGGWVSQTIREHPDLLDRIAATVRVPLRLIHVVRNPWDNIAAISRWHRMTLDESIAFYFAHCDVTAALVGRADTLTFRHETLIETPREVLASVCRHLGLAAEDDYLSACAAIVFERPTGSRRTVEWRPEQVREIARRAAGVGFLAGYEFAGASAP